MPVEIRELLIRVNVNEHQQTAGNAGADPAVSEHERQKKEDALVAECIEQTIRILKQQKER